MQTKLATQWDPSPGWQSVVSGVQFNAFGAVTSLNHLGLTESRTYNVLGQMTRMTKGSLIDVEYRFSATANDGKILSQKNWLTGEDVTYQYDELERLISASTTAGTSWGLSWTYDGFGNRLSQTVTQGTGPSSVTLVNGNTNRVSSAGYAYDLNGNMTQMPKGSGSMTLDYDLSNRVSGVSHPDGAEQYRYAPDNRRVWRSAGRTACYAGRGDGGELYWSGSGESATEQVVFYSPGGQKMGAYCLSFSANLQYFAVTASEENVFYGGRLVGKRLVSVTGSNNGLVSAFTADRLQSKGNGSNYYPYGESKTSTAGDDREGFATYTRDEKNGLDYADQRWYASGVGRFTAPDPYQASAGPSDPGSWNRFTYVRGEPIGRYDPLGLADCVANQPCNITVTDQAPPAPAIPSGPGGVNAPSLMLPPPGEGAPAVPILDSFTQDGITFIGHTTNTETDREIKARLTALVSNLDSDCEKWLSDGLHNLSAGSSLSSFVQQLLPGVGSAYRIYKDNDPGSVINATQGAGDSGNITINATGAYYVNRVNLGGCTNGIKSASERAKTLLLIHELAHIVLAAGFLSDRDNASAGESNNLLLRKNCDKTLSKYKN